MTIDTCPGCHLPAHASETDDDGYHPGCHGSVADAYLDAISIELTDIGADDLLPYVSSARHHDAHAIAVIAAYVVERDANLFRGRSRKWLVTGGAAPRHGACYSTHERAVKAATRMGGSVRPGYGDRYGWSSISAAWYGRLAQHAISLQAAQERV